MRGPSVVHGSGACPRCLRPPRTTTVASAGSCSARNSTRCSIRWLTLRTMTPESNWYAGSGGLREATLINAKPGSPTVPQGCRAHFGALLHSALAEGSEKMRGRRRRDAGVDLSVPVMCHGNVRGRAQPRFSMKTGNESAHVGGDNRPLGERVLAPAGLASVARERSQHAQRVRAAPSRRTTTPGRWRCRGCVRRCAPQAPQVVRGALAPGGDGVRRRRRAAPGTGPFKGPNRRLFLWSRRSRRRRPRGRVGAALGRVRGVQ